MNYVKVLSLPDRTKSDDLPEKNTYKFESVIIDGTLSVGGARANVEP